MSLVAAVEVGSLYTLSRSLIYYLRADCFLSLMSFLSFAFCDCCIAALWRDPSGFLLIYTDCKAKCDLEVCPYKNGASFSFNSMSACYSSNSISSKSISMFGSSIILMIPPPSNLDFNQSASGSICLFYRSWDSDTSSTIPVKDPTPSLLFEDCKLWMICKSC